jgi:hypothetical protein
VFQEVNAAHPGFDNHWFLEKRLQTQAILYRFQQDHIPHALLFMVILSQVDRGLTHQILPSMAFLQRLAWFLCTYQAHRHVHHIHVRLLTEM